MEAALKISRLRKDFRLPNSRHFVRAIDDLSLEIGRGEVFGLLGPNGSGKSTTIRILLGVTQPSSGTAELFSQSPKRARARQKVGYLPDAPIYHSFLTASEYLAYMARLSGVSKAEISKRGDELLDRFGIADARHRRISGFSKGMLQRLGFAQALIADPELLILDEPTAGVDPIGASEIGAFIRELKGEGKTILLCSHLLSQVEAVCDRIGILNKGKLLTVGPVDRLLSDQGDGRSDFRLRGVPSDMQHRVFELGEDLGVSVSPAARSLEDLFRNLVRGDADHD